MKYCLFDGGEVIGPLPAEELMARTGFDAHSLVCPEEYSEEEDYWKEAALYPDFGFDTETEKQEPVPVAEPAVAAQEIMQEIVSEPAPETVPTEKVVLSEPSIQTTEENNSQISSLLLQASKKMEQEKTAAPSEQSIQPFAENETVADQAPTSSEDVSVQLVSTARSPIEEYFNSMRTGDLGNILGIPDPKLNSDLNLVNMLEKQFEKTDPNMLTASQKKLEEKDPFDSFVSSPATEELDTFLKTRRENATPDEKDFATQEQLQRELKEKEKITASIWPSGEEAPADIEEKAATTDSQQGAFVLPLQEDDPDDRTVQTILEGSFNVERGEGELPEPIKRVQAPRPTATLPVFDSKKVIVPTDPEASSAWLKWLGLAVGVLLLLAGVLLNFALSRGKQPAQEPETSVQEQLLEQPAQPAAPAAKPAAAAVEPKVSAKPAAAAPAVIIKTPEEQAVEIVQNYVLSGNRGTVKDFLNQHYAEKLAAGYTENWSAEPLHRNIYVVKYRLSKTRQEPIMYIFQADTAKKKLTGALNNITLDLVGKIK